MFSSKKQRLLAISLGLLATVPFWIVIYLFGGTAISGWLDSRYLDQHGQGTAATFLAYDDRGKGARVEYSYLVAGNDDTFVEYEKWEEVIEGAGFQDYQAGDELHVVFDPGPMPKSWITTMTLVG